MKKLTSIIKKPTAIFMLLALAVSSLGISSASIAHAITTTPTWNTTGNYVVNMEYLGTQYPHDMSLTQDSLGNLTGNGGSPAGTNTHKWVITSGLVSGNSINITANYTATPDAVTPQTVLNLTGTIATDGTMSGTWSDNYQGGTRTGAFLTTNGNAVALGSMTAQDFGVMNISDVKGYTAGFGLTDATLAGATSVITKLYSGSTLLQTDTAIIPKFNTDITGTQFSSPFDVFGSFNYATDGYWTNVRESEYGQTLIPTSVVSTVTLANGKVVTATNSTLTGDTSTIFPTSTTTTVYKDCSYGGYAINLQPGNYTTSQLLTAGIIDKDISSIKVQSGYQVALYPNDNFTGTPLILNSDNSCFVDNSFNDMTSSIKITSLIASNVNITTNPASTVTSTDAMLNGTNGNNDASGHSLWVSLAPFVTTSTTIPTGVYSTPDMGAIAANTSFSASLSSVTTSGVPGNLPTITPNTTYYFAAWSNVGGTWYPGAVLNFTTSTVTPTPTNSTVHIFKYIDGVQATTTNANSVNFPMYTSTYSAPFTLGPTGWITGDIAYETSTSPMNLGSSYSANETLTTSLVGTTCDEHQYSLIGYQVGDTLALAQAATSTLAIPSFTNLQGDKYIIVDNHLCSSGTGSGTEGTIGGTVTGDQGVLHVDSITSAETNANGTADNTYAHGWSYTFHITAPTNEPNLSVKFADWLSGANIIPVANNMQISSAQASNGPITLTAANLYSSPALIMTGDLDPSTAGRQVDVVVQVKIPVSTVNGSYTTSYGIQTN